MTKARKVKSEDGDNGGGEPDKKSKWWNTEKSINDAMHLMKPTVDNAVKDVRTLLNGMNMLERESCPALERRRQITSSRRGRS